MNNNETFIKPSPVKTGQKNYVFRCPLSPCPFHCRTYHNFNAHIESQHYCLDCSAYCVHLHQHVCTRQGQRRGHVDTGLELNLTHFYELSRSHGGTVIMYQYKDPINSTDIEATFSDLESILTQFLEQLFVIHGHSKVEFTMGIKMEKEIQDDQGNKSYKSAVIYFKTAHREVVSRDDIPLILLSSTSDIVQKKNTFINNGSGWYVINIEELDLKIGEVRLFQDAAAGGYLPMPLRQRKGFINFRNNDDRCFLYCIAAALFLDPSQLELRNNRGIYKLKHLKTYFERFDLTGLKFPVSVTQDIPIFESRNNVGINVLSHQDGKVVPVRACPNSFTKKVTLFLIRKQVGSEWKQHYVLITDVNRFLRNKRNYRRYFCEKCFRNFTSAENLGIHRESCVDQKIHEVFPKQGQCVEFKRLEMTLPYPYLLFWDLECYSEPVDKQKGKSTRLQSEYKVASYSLCLVYNNGSTTEVRAFEYYDGPDVIKHFYERVFFHATNVLCEIRNTNNFLLPTQEELERHERATHCAFCAREFTRQDSSAFADDEDDTSLRRRGYHRTREVLKCFHHNHITGKYEYALCQACNLKVKYKNELVCIAHNGSGFDFHFLLQNLESELFDAKNVDVIAKSAEKVIQIEITAKNLYIPSIKRSFDHADPKRFCGSRRVKVRFIDSYKFLSSSLSTLASSLKKENAGSYSLLRDGLKYIFPDSYNRLSESSIQLLTEKLAYPYAYLTSPDVLQDDHPIPQRHWFDNDLRNEKITDDEWETVQKLIREFDIQDFRQFTRLYTMSDTILLAIVWENFRAQCLSAYKLEPSCVCTVSGYSWQCFLHYTNAKIEYIRDKKMLAMLKDGIRGGTSFCTQKIVTANNERSPFGFDPDKERTHLLSFDLNSLYATAMLDKFPQSEYQWVQLEELESKDWSLYDGQGDDGQDVGYILKVDLGYPEQVQDNTVDLPLAPEKCVIHLEQLSTSQRRTINMLGLDKTFTSAPRLLTHCGERSEYVLHYKALRYYLQKGMILKKIYCGIKFFEKPYFRDYITFNVEQRKAAKSESQRNLFKLMNNSIFGKTLESSDGKYEVKFCSSATESRKYVSSPLCVDFSTLTANLSMVLLKPSKIKLDKPIQAGMTVLDIAKTIFYRGYYDQIRETFHGRTYNLYTDTDSTFVLVRDPQDTLWEDLFGSRQYFDFSKIPSAHPFFEKFAHFPNIRTENAGKAGLWKIESMDIAQLITLKSKQYSILYFDEEETRKSKGIPWSCLKTFRHAQYKSVIENKQLIRFDVNMIRSFKHRLYNIVVNKVGFHCADIYRVYPDPNNINFSLPLGHYRLRSYMSAL